MFKEALSTRTHCRAQGGSLSDVLDLGLLYLNDFPSFGDPPPPRFPLVLSVASDSQLVQLRHSVDPNLMFRRYWYRSGTNESMRLHLRNLVMDLSSRVSLRSGDVVVDIGCNDGTLLNTYDPALLRIGFDPAELVPQGTDMFINDFFSAAQYGDLPKASVVTSIAMFYDLEDPVAFAQDVARILRTDGLWIIEMHYLPEMLRSNGFDAICHEHLCYYSLRSLQYVLAQAGMYIQDVSFNPVNGGSVRAFVRKMGCGQATPAVFKALEKENEDADFASFQQRLEQNKLRTLELLTNLKRQGKRLLGYGASTKGNTLLQYYGIEPDLLPAIADRTPEKWGRITVGTEIPIVSEETAHQMKPDYFFVLPYHFLPAFMERERVFLNAGGKFIRPLPTPEVVP